MKKWRVTLDTFVSLTVLAPDPDQAEQEAQRIVVETLTAKGFVADAGYVYHLEGTE